MQVPWRRQWQPTPVFLPGKLHGQRSLVGYSPQGCRARHDREHINTPQHQTRDLCICMGSYAHIPQFCPVREPVTHILAAVSTAGTEILASNTQYHYPIKEIRILGDMNSRAGSGNTQDKPGTSLVTGKKIFFNKKVTREGHSRGVGGNVKETQHRNQPKRSPNN